MSPLKHSTNIAARMGRWSASHRKTAIFGWLAFVVAAFAISFFVPMKMIDDTDFNVGEARTGDHIIRDGGFKLDEQGEFVLVQSKTKTTDDPAFRAVVNQAVAALDGYPQVTKLRSPLAAGNEGQISKDGHSALIQFSPEGTYDEAITYIDTITAATDKVQAANPDFYVGEAGSASTGKALDEMFKGPARNCGPPVHPADPRDPSARVRLARRRNDPAPARAHVRVRDHGPRRTAEPDRADGRVDRRGHPPDRTGSRRRLLALLHPPRA